MAQRYANLAERQDKMSIPLKHRVYELKIKFDVGQKLAAKAPEEGWVFVTLGRGVPPSP